VEGGGNGVWEGEKDFDEKRKREMRTEKRRRGGGDPKQHTN
jgi:hypothetical protein